MMKVLFINNDGAGFAETLELKPGTTVGEVFDDQLGSDSAAYLIRVNREIAAPETVLVDGDKLTMTPTKIDGA